jgi:hypothetical protein
MPLYMAHVRTGISSDQFLLPSFDQTKRTCIFRNHPWGRTMFWTSAVYIPLNGGNYSRCAPAEAAAVTIRNSPRSGTQQQRGEIIVQEETSPTTPVRPFGETVQACGIWNPESGGAGWQSRRRRLLPGSPHGFTFSDTAVSAGIFSACGICIWIFWNLFLSDVCRWMQRRDLTDLTIESDTRP